MPAKNTLSLLTTCLLLSLSQFHALHGQPRQFDFEHLTVEDGLPENSVQAILQDHLGFLWLGTASGLVRYNGYSMTVFAPDPADSTSIGSGHITSLYEDEAGALWIGAGRGSLYRFDHRTEGFTRYVLDDGGEPESRSIRFITADREGRLWLIPGGNGGGLYRLDPTTGRITQYRHDPDAPRSLSHNTVRDFYQGRDGTLWVGTSGGLNRFDPETETFTRFLYDPLDPASPSWPPSVRTLLEDRQGVLWIGTRQGGLNRFDPETETFTPYVHALDDSTSLSHDTVHFIHEDSTGTLWIGTGQGLNRFDAASGTFTRFLPVPGAALDSRRNSILTLFEDQEGLFWLSTPTPVVQQGQPKVVIDNPTQLYSFDPGTGAFVFHEPDLEDPNSFDPASGIQSFYQDRAGTLWIGTFKGGINKLDRYTTKFSHYSFGSERVRAIQEDREGRLWIGTGALIAIPQGGALHRLDPETGEVTSYRNVPGDSTSLSWNYVGDLFEDRRGRLWVASVFGLELFDPATGTFRQRYVPYRSRVSSVSDIVEGREGTLWISSFFVGLLRFDAATGTFKYYRHDPDDPQSIPSDFLVCLRFDRDGILWIGTEGGGLMTTERGGLMTEDFAQRAIGGGELIRFDPATERVTSYADLVPGLVAITYIHEDTRGRLWLATRTKGLLRFDRDTGEVKRFTTREGLAHNSVTGILEDRDGQLWLSTVAGLSRFDPEEGTFRNYDASDGLQGQYFIDRSAFAGKDGDLYFGGRHGLNIVDPDRVRDNPHPPQVVLTGLRVFGRDLVPREEGPLRAHLSVTEEVELSHRQNEVTFEFVGLHFSRPEKNRYQYRLEGYDNDWSEPGTQRTATYTNLDPDTYTFRVQAANADGIWSEEGTSVRLVIMPPWWQRAWFYALCLLGLLALAYTGYQARVHQLRMQARALQEQVAERTRELVVEQQKTEEQAGRLKELDEAKSRFFANISHEFRTPLTLIMGPLQDALARPEAPVLSRPQLQRIHRSSLRLLRLVKQLFDLSKLEASQMRLNRQPGEIADFLGELVRSFAPLAERRQITLQYRAEAEVRPFAFDPEALEKVFSNLLSNALKFTPAGGKVWVTVHPRSERGEEAVEVVVKDTGPGIAGSALESIFERFEQVDGGATRAHEGMGLGLALARELVELHGGALRVESEVGFGSAFTVWLPLEEVAGASVVEAAAAEDRFATLEEAAELEAAALPLDGHHAEAEPTGSLEQPVVLVVEDHPDVRELLQDYLGADYRLLEAADGTAGLEAAREHRPDLVLSDVMMPGLDGYALCRALKADEVLRTIPVMLLTARASEADRIYGLEGGADDYLSKPFSRRELEVRVANLILSRRQMRRQFSREIRVKPTDVVVQAEDEAFLERVLEVLEAHLSDSTFTTDRLADAVGLSRRQAERRVKEVTGETPPKLLRRLRLARAAQLLKARPGSISEVAYTVGFNSPSHFAMVFRERYGVSPTEHIENTT
ncbi:MAG TPA: two-component regulator propeller domain-containing protein [Kiloniellaceae bacterium]|nr:two-component regulator propeller domain-containing protein [Kiloniellaceae bacterium]